MDLVESYRHSVRDFAELVRHVRPADWTAPTPCADWDVRTLVNHVVNEESWVEPLMSGATIEEVGDRFDGDLLGDDPAGHAAEVARHAESAVPAPSALRRTVHLSFGDAPAEEYVSQLLADHVVHSWDLAASIGERPPMDPEVVHTTAEWFRDREEMYRESGAIGPRVEVPDDVSEAERLLAAFGRDPHWSPTVGAMRRYLDAIDSRDVDRLRATITDDCVWETTGPPDGDRIEGADAMLALFGRMFAETGEPRFTAEAVFACGDRGVTQWRYDWRNPDGSEGHVRGTSIMRVRDGRVCETFAYVKG